MWFFVSVVILVASGESTVNAFSVHLFTSLVGILIREITKHLLLSCTFCDRLSFGRLVSRDT